MQIEAARLIQGALLDAGYGANVKLAALALDGSDPAPAAWAAGNIVEDSSDDRAALRRPESADVTSESTLYPSLLINAPVVEWKDSEWAQTNQGMYADVHVIVRVALNIVDPSVALRETYYRLTAVEHSLRGFALQADAARTRNGVYLMSLKSMTRLLATNDPRDALVTGGVQVVWQAFATAAT